MAKKSAIEKNKSRAKLTARFAEKRAKLKAVAKDPAVSAEDQFMARLELAKLPRNGSATRVRNRCEVTGRPRAYYRKFKMSRIALRDLASDGLVPGVVKSSW